MEKKIDEKYCESCGAIIKIAAEICPKCGVRQKTSYGNSYNNVSSQQGKNWLSTLLLCFFFGWLGFHRFYTGSIGIGFLQLISVGGCGIWTLIDFIMILTESYRDGNGLPLIR